MRTLATLATLLVGLAFIFWAPAANADCPHGTKTDHPHCDVVEPPPPGAPVVVDATGALVGRVLGAVTDQPFVLLTVDGVSYVVRASPSGEFSVFEGYLFFGTEDCTGQAYGFHTEGADWEGIDAAVVRPGNQLWVQDGDPIPALSTDSRTLLNSDDCKVQPGAVRPDVVPMRYVLDLDDEFQAPFDLKF